METPKPNLAMRKKLAAIWAAMTDEQKLTKRAERSRQGVKCDICSTIGYYREICVNGCVSPPKTPDSMDSTPPGTPPEEPVGLGVFWGSNFSTATDESPRGRYDFKKKVDVNTVRPQAKIEESKLKASDASVGTFEFFAQADEGYARNYPELTLHQVMRRLMRLLERQLHMNADKLEAAFDTTLLHPPAEKDRATFYPAELGEIKAHRDYFLNKDLKKDRRLNLKYKNQARLRPVDDLDPLFRGGVVDDKFLYETSKSAGASMHSKNTWKSVLSHSDDLASSDPTMAGKQAKMDRLFAQQGKWIAMQQRSMTHRNDRFEHLVHMLRNEMAAEHAREAKALQASKHASKSTLMGVWQERLQSVDLIMQCLSAYNFTSGLDEADFLVFCFEKWKETLQGKVLGGAQGSLPQIKASSSGKKGGKQPKPAGNPAVTGHNTLIAASSPYFADLQAVAADEKKTRRMRDQALAASAAARALNESKAKETNSTTVSLSGSNSHIGGLASHSSSCAQLTSTRNSPLNSARTGGSNNETMESPQHSRRNSHTRTLAGNLTVSNKSTGQLQLGHSRQSTLSHMHSMSSLQSGNTYNTLSDQHSGVQSLTAQQRVDSSVEAAMQHSVGLVEAARDKKAKRKLMQNSRAVRHFHVVHRKHQREIDMENIAKAKGAFIAADLADHIRKGRDDDLAFLAPTLIPVPGAFDGDGRHPVSSYVGQNIIYQKKKDMILSDLGYTPQSMVPLYVRNTLIETNGTTPGGDQSYDMMSTDRRYSHYIGRALNRFEEVSNASVESSSGTGGSSSGYGLKPTSLILSKSSKERTSSNLSHYSPKKIGGSATSLSTSAKGFGKQLAPIAATAAEMKEAKHKVREQRRQLAAEMRKAKETPLTHSLVRLVFKNPEPSLADLNYLDEI